MISYAPFWKTIKDKGISTYALITDHEINSATIQRLRHNRGISTETINALCNILNCKIDEIIEHIPDN